MMWRSRSGPHDDGAGDIRTGPDGAIALDERVLGERAGNAETLGGGRFPLRFYRPVAAWLSDLSRRCAIRTQLLLILVGLMIAAWLIGGAITILHARQSTRIEITAAMNLAEALVHEAAPMIEHSTAPERALAAIPAQVGSIRHVRISVTDAAGLPLQTVAAQHGSAKHVTTQPAAPGWFAALIAPAIEHRYVPIMVQGRRLGAVMLTSAPGDEIAEVWNDTTALARLTLIFGAAATAILYLLFARVLAPLERLAAGLLDLERRDYKVRLGPPNVRELAVIATRFNTLAAALDSMRAENKSLNKRLIAAQDTERRQTARDLHDEVGPWLFALKANATSIAKLGDPAAAQGRAREMLGMIERLQLVNRGVLNRLRPMALGQIPLVDLLSTLVQERAREHSDVAISFASQGLAATYGESIDLTIYRCVQESLTNIVRHAAAQRARLELAHVRNAPNAGDGRLILTVTDDGCGIGPGTPKGRGLQGMQERVAALDGEFSAENAPGGGTVLRIVIPLPDPMDS